MGKPQLQDFHSISLSTSFFCLLVPYLILECSQDWEKGIVYCSTFLEQFWSYFRSQYGWSRGPQQPLWNCLEAVEEFGFTWWVRLHFWAQVVSGWFWTPLGSFPKYVCLGCPCSLTPYWKWPCYFSSPLTQTSWTHTAGWLAVLLPLGPPSPKQRVINIEHLT